MISGDNSYHKYIKYKNKYMKLKMQNTQLGGCTNKKDFIPIDTNTKIGDNTPYNTYGFYTYHDKGINYKEINITPDKLELKYRNISDLIKKIKKFKKEDQPFILMYYYDKLKNDDEIMSFFDRENMYMTYGIEFMENVKENINKYNLNKSERKKLLNLDKVRNVLLKYKIHISRSKDMVNVEYKVPNYYSKPLVGLWYSFGTGWYDYWSLSKDNYIVVIYFNENFKLLRLVPDDDYDKIISNDINKNINIISYKLFQENYVIEEMQKQNDGIEKIMKVINYRKITKEDGYDGIEFCPHDHFHGDFSFGYGKYPWASGIDLSSGCIFNTKHITVHKLKNNIYTN